MVELNKIHIAVTIYSYRSGLRDYMMKVYNYMTSGLAISGLVAWGFLSLLL